MYESFTHNIFQDDFNNEREIIATPINSFDIAFIKWYFYVFKTTQKYNLIFINAKMGEKN
jgi:hypothetical protein